jgi:hypothetical protein
MKTLLRLFLICTSGAATLLIPPAQAVAYPDVAVTIDVDGAYLPISDCAYHDYTVTVTPNAEVRSWSADVTIEGPDGEYVSSDYFYGSGYSIEFGEVFLCPYTDEPGLYSIDVDVDATDANYDTTAGAYEYEFFESASRHPRSW